MRYLRSKTSWAAFRVEREVGMLTVQGLSMSTTTLSTWTHTQSRASASASAGFPSKAQNEYAWGKDEEDDGMDGIWMRTALVRWGCIYRHGC
jgi:hypothetical protein